MHAEDRQVKPASETAAPAGSLPGSASSEAATERESASVEPFATTTSSVISAADLARLLAGAVAGGTQDADPADAALGRLARAVLEVVPTAIAVLSVPDHIVILANHRFRRSIARIGASVDPIGRTLETLLPDSIRVRAVALLSQADASGLPADLRDFIFDTDAATSYWHVSVVPLRASDDAPAALLLSAEEATRSVVSRLHAERLARRLRATNEQLTLANLRLETVIARLPQGIIAIDAGSRVALANRAAVELLGTALAVGAPLYAPGVARQKPDGTLYEIAELPLSRSLRGETCYGVQITVRQPGGRQVETLCSSAPLHNASHDVVGAVSIFQDITELRRVDRLKDEFISIASHELKNPLAVVKGYVQVLTRGAPSLTPTHQIAMLQVINRETDRLTRLINVMLDISRIALGELQLARERTDLVPIARRLVENVQGVSPCHQIRLVEPAGDLELPEIWGEWDETRIEQVISNLIDNAVKYSPAGGEVVISLESDGERAEVTITDEGIGIPEGERQHLFEKFHRSTGPAVQSIGGMGLGLYLCQEIVHAHGGVIWFTSEVGRGSQFHFTLPLAVAS